MTEPTLYPFRIKFRWWYFGKTILLYASCSGEAMAIAWSRWRGVKSAEQVGQPSEYPPTTRGGTA